MPHHWITVRLGRICSECSTVQENGKFSDDGPPCTKDKPYGPPDRDDKRADTEEARER
jgi:hypothetical protein